MITFLKTMLNAQWMLIVVERGTEKRLPGLAGASSLQQVMDVRHTEKQR